MPILFNEETNQYEGTLSSDETLPGFDFSVFGGMITNNGTFNGAITADTPENIIIENAFGGFITKVSGSPFAVSLLGNGGRNFTNDGTIFGAARFGNGFDSFYNTGTLNGRLDMGNGNDLLVNQVIPGIDGGPLTIGVITGGAFLGEGNDLVLNGGSMANVILGAGNDTYNATAFSEFSGVDGTANAVLGGNGNDNLIGGGGDDKFRGGAGQDTLEGGAGKDKLYGEDGSDLITAGDGNDLVDGGTGNDTISGGDNNDRLLGGSGNDDIDGGAGNDRLLGGDGNDTLEGGAGHDVMIGGAGADVFVFSPDSGRDKITDFGANDQIELSFPFAPDLSYSDVIANTRFTNTDAIIDLSALLSLSGGDFRDSGSQLILKNVTLDDLLPDSFIFGSEILTVG